MKHLLAFALVACFVLCGITYAFGGNPNPQMVITTVQAGGLATAPATTMPIPAAANPGDTLVLSCHVFGNSSPLPISTPTNAAGANWTLGTNNQVPGASSKLISTVYYETMVGGDSTVGLKSQGSTQVQNISCQLSVWRAATTVTVYPTAGTTTTPIALSVSTAAPGANQAAYAVFTNLTTSVTPTPTPTGTWMLVTGSRTSNQSVSTAMQLKGLTAAATAYQAGALYGVGNAPGQYTVELIYIGGTSNGPGVLSLMGVGGGVAPSSVATSVPLHWGTYDQDITHAATNSPQPGLYPQTSLGCNGELSWVEAQEPPNTTNNHYYATNCVAVLQYTDTSAVVATGAGPTWENTYVSNTVSVLGTPTPDPWAPVSSYPNPKYFYDSSNNNLYENNNKWASVNPLNAYPLFPSTLLWTHDPADTSAWYLDSVWNLGFHDRATGAAADIYYNGNTYKWNNATPYNSIDNIWNPALSALNAITPIWCDCWGGDSGNPYLSGSYFGIPSADMGSITPSARYVCCVSGGRSEGAFMLFGKWNSASVWEGVENMIIVTRNTNGGVYDFVKNGMAEDPTTTATPVPTAAPTACPNCGQSDRMFIQSSAEIAGDPVYTPVQIVTSGGSLQGGVCYYNPCDHVFPESQVVWDSPVVAQPQNSNSGCSSNCNGIFTFQSAATGNPFFREVYNIYYHGVRCGRGLIVVNPNNVVVNAPTPTTDAVLTEDWTTKAGIEKLILTGGEIDSGGTAAWGAGNLPTTLGPWTGGFYCDPSL